MDLRIYKSCRSLQTGYRNHRLPWGRAFFFLASLAGISSAHAQSEPTDAPWVPSIVEALDEYVPDPFFNHGHLGLDHFAAPNSADAVGLVTALLSNGDSVVAGLVPDFDASGTCSNGTTPCNIGLVRYDQTGARRAWSNPGTIGHYGDNYVVYPGGDSHKFLYLRDVKVRTGFIDVLVDEIDAANSGAGLGRQNARIVTFREDGAYYSQFPVFGSTFNASSDTLDFYGTQMIQITSTRMIVVGTTYDSDGPFMAVSRLDILANGAFDLDPSWGETYGGAGLDQVRYYPAPGSYCGAIYCDVIPGFVARAVGTNFEDFYVGSSIHINGSDWDPIVAKISSQSGDLKSEFNSTGWSRPAFNQANSSFNDTVAGLYVYQDEVYLAAAVAQKCFPGIGIAKLNGSTGQYDTAFSGGKIVFGGQGDAPFCFSPPGGDFPTAISATGGRIGIVGYSHHGIAGISNLYDPMLAVVDAVGGVVLDFDTHPVTDASGARLGDAALYSVFGGASPQSPFTVAGNGRIASAGNTLSYLVGKLVPVSADRIFASTFGGDN